MRPFMPVHRAALALLTALGVIAMMPLAGPAWAVTPGYHVTQGHHGHNRRGSHDGCPRGMVRDPQAMALHDGRPPQGGCRRAHGPGFIERHFHRHRHHQGVHQGHHRRHHGGHHRGHQRKP